MKKVLVVDDEARIRKIVRDYLVMNGYEVIEAQDGEQAVDDVMSDSSIDLIIMDIMMPNMDGYEALKSIRRFSKIPVIMLTAKSEEKDELKGFDLGVDEYITKPFSPKILVARVDAVMRRTTKAEGDHLIAGGIDVDLSAHTVKAGGRDVELSFKEFELLTYFMENAGIALNREKILNSVWNYDYFGDARTIDTHVKKLRAKLGEQGDCIKTVWGMGYKFEA